jgi:hypothetical protein
MISSSWTPSAVQVPWVWQQFAVAAHISVAITIVPHSLWQRSASV